jgi:hypothetical protein
VQEAGSEALVRDSDYPFDLQRNKSQDQADGLLEVFGIVPQGYGFWAVASNVWN